MEQTYKYDVLNPYTSNMSNFKVKQRLYPLWLCEYDDRSLLCNACPEKPLCIIIDEDEGKRNVYE